MVKKFLVATAVTALAAVVPASAAFAHHGGGSHKKGGDTSCLALCDVDLDKNKVHVRL